MDFIYFIIDPQTVAPSSKYKSLTKTNLFSHMDFRMKYTLTHYLYSNVIIYKTFFHHKINTLLLLSHEAYVLCLVQAFTDQMSFVLNQ